MPKIAEWMNKAARRFADQDVNASDRNFDQLIEWYANIIAEEFAAVDDNRKGPAPDREAL